MFKISYMSFVFGTFFSILLLQQLNCKPLPQKQTDVGSTKPDPFAQEAADAIDSALWFLKDSFAHLIEDTSKINKMLMNVTEKLSKLTPADVKMQDEESHKRLREQTLRANKTLHEQLAKENGNQS